jgi:hypothetical protein
MFLVGKWSPSNRSFRVRVFQRKRTSTVTLARQAQVQEAAVPDCRELSSAGIALANE